MIQKSCIVLELTPVPGAHTSTRKFVVGTSPVFDRKNLCYVAYFDQLKRYGPNQGYLHLPSVNLFDLIDANPNLFNIKEC